MVTEPENRIGIQKMKYFIIFLFTISIFPVYANDEDIPIGNSNELRDWCKTETESFYVANSITPFNWSSSGWIKGNTLFAEGSWKVGRETVFVNCHIQKGAKTKYAVYEFSDKR